jgi:hypothetical protein
VTLGTGASEDYWRRPGDDFAVGDVFSSVPVLSVESRPQTHRDEVGKYRIYLPTATQPALLIHMFFRAWWFAPLITRESLRNPEGFDTKYAAAEDGLMPGWLPLPPLNTGVPQVLGRSLALLLRPTVLEEVTFNLWPTRRLASLTDYGRERLADELTRGLAEGA